MISKEKVKLFKVGILLGLIFSFIQSFIFLINNIRDFIFEDLWMDIVDDLDGLFYGSSNLKEVLGSIGDLFSNIWWNLSGGDPISTSLWELLGEFIIGIFHPAVLIPFIVIGLILAIAIFKLKVFKKIRENFVKLKIKRKVWTLIGFVLFMWFLSIIPSFGGFLLLLFILFLIVVTIYENRRKINFLAPFVSSLIMFFVFVIFFFIYLMRYGPSQDGFEFLVYGLGSLIYSFIASGIYFLISYFITKYISKFKLSKIKIFLLTFLIMILFFGLVYAYSNTCSFRYLTLDEGVGNSCVLAKIEPFNNPKYCDKLKGERPISSCYMRFALQNSDVNLCKGSVKGKCIKELAFQLNSSELCYNSEIYKDECFFHFAIGENDSSYCYLLDKKREDCFFHFAVEEAEISYCDLLDDKSGDCFFHFATLNNDYKLCYKSGINKGSCFYQFAKTEFNPDLCMLGGPGYKSKCYYEYALLLNSVEYCSLAKDEKVGYVALCFFELAHKLNDYTICKNIPPPDEGYKERCIYEVILQMNDPILCKFAPNERLKDLCYYEYEHS